MGHQSSDTVIGHQGDVSFSKANNSRSVHRQQARRRRETKIKKRRRREKDDETTYHRLIIHRHHGNVTKMKMREQQLSPPGDRARRYGTIDSYVVSRYVCQRTTTESSEWRQQSALKKKEERGGGGVTRRTFSSLILLGLKYNWTRHPWNREENTIIQLILLLVRCARVSHDARVWCWVLVVVRVGSLLWWRRVT